MNKVVLMGNLGSDPDTRYMPSGQAATNISVAMLFLTMTGVQTEVLCVYCSWALTVR